MIFKKLKFFLFIQNNVNSMTAFCPLKPERNFYCLTELYLLNIFCLGYTMHRVTNVKYIHIVKIMKMFRFFISEYWLKYKNSKYVQP